MYTSLMKDFDSWRNDPASPYYDHGLISYRLKQFKKVYESQDILEIKDLLRSGNLTLGENMN